MILRYAKHFLGSLIVFLFTATTLFAGDITITVKKSDGSVYPGVKIEYLDGYWKNLGTTNASGEASKTLTNGNYDFRASVGATYSPTQNFSVTASSTGLFYTSTVKVCTWQSDGTTPIVGAKAEYEQSYYRNIGNTNGSGFVSRELFAGTYNVKVTKGALSVVQSAVVPGDGATSGQEVKVNFYASKILVKVCASDGSTPVQGVKAEYFQSYYRNIGNTNASGEIALESFPIAGALPVRCTFGATTCVPQNVSMPGDGTTANAVQIVKFYTSTLKLCAWKSDGTTPFSGVNMKYEQSYYRTVGNTNGSGFVSRELFAGTYNVQATSGALSVVQSAVLPGDGATAGQEVKVNFYASRILVKVCESDGTTPISGVRAEYFQSYDRTIGNTNGAGEVALESFPIAGILPIKCTKGATISAYQNATMPGDGTTPGASITVKFHTSTVTVKVVDCDDNPISGVATAYLSSYYRNIGTTPANGMTTIELFPGTYTFRTIKSGVTKYQDKVVPGNSIISGSSVIVRFPPEIEVAVSKVDVSCFGEMDGSISAVASGGASGFTYSWTGPNSFSSSASSISGLGGGTYNLTVTDVDGCYEIIGVSILGPDAIVVYFDPSAYGAYNISTSGGSDGFIRTIVKGGNTPYNYSWTGPGNPTGANIFGLSAGKYFLEITDANGCSVTGGPFNLIEP